MATSVPATPNILGWAGIVPLVAANGVLALEIAEWGDAAMGVGLIYSALILSFVGGTWWGIAATAPAAEGRGALGWVWCAAVVPSLMAFAILLALLLDFSFGGYGPLASALLLMGGAIVLTPLVDSALTRREGLAVAPQWWTRLRWPLSLVLGGLTIILALQGTSN